MYLCAFACVSVSVCVVCVCDRRKKGWKKEERMAERKEGGKEDRQTETKKEKEGAWQTDRKAKVAEGRAVRQAVEPEPDVAENGKCLQRGQEE